LTFLKVQQNYIYHFVSKADNSIFSEDHSFGSRLKKGTSGQQKSHSVLVFLPLSWLGQLGKN